LRRVESERQTEVREAESREAEAREAKDKKTKTTHKLENKNISQI
jgi:hypothetical protein